MDNTKLKVLVTGASTGIGRAVAVELARNGAHVFLASRSTMRLKETAQLISSAGGSSQIIPTDLRKTSDLDNLVDLIKKSSQRLDIMIHAAGVWHNDKIAYAGVALVDTPEDQIREVIDVGITAPMLLTRSLLPLMIPHKQGKILCISGTFASGGAGWLHYYVSKLALEHFTVGLAQELRQYEIQVNCISPSDTNTEALRKYFPDDAATAIDPNEIAKLARFLVSTDSDHLTGQCIVIKNKNVH